MDLVRPIITYSSSRTVKLPGIVVKKIEPFLRLPFSYRRQTSNSLFGVVVPIPILPVSVIANILPTPSKLKSLFFLNHHQKIKLIFNCINSKYLPSVISNWSPLAAIRSAVEGVVPIPTLTSSYLKLLPVLVSVALLRKLSDSIA